MVMGVHDQRPVHVEQGDATESSLQDVDGCRHARSSYRPGVTTLAIIRCPCASLNAGVFPRTTLRGGCSGFVSGIDALVRTLEPGLRSAAPRLDKASSSLAEEALGVVSRSPCGTRSAGPTKPDFEQRRRVACGGCQGTLPRVEDVVPWERRVERNLAGHFASGGGSVSAASVGMRSQGVFRSAEG